MEAFLLFPASDPFIFEYIIGSLFQPLGNIESILLRRVELVSLFPLPKYLLCKEFEFCSLKIVSIQLTYPAYLSLHYEKRLLEESLFGELCLKPFLILE
jgi:hypothetical protein